MRKHIMYTVTAQVYTEDSGFTGSRQIPTFYLDSAIQGIMNEQHARHIAQTIIDPLNKLTLNISVERREILVSA